MRGRATGVAEKVTVLHLLNHTAGWAAERELFAELFDTQDQKEGVNAFLEKRSPSWKNA